MCVLFVWWDRGLNYGETTREHVSLKSRLSNRDRSWPAGRSPVTWTVQLHWDIARTLPGINNHALLGIECSTGRLDLWKHILTQSIMGVQEPLTRKGICATIINRIKQNTQPRVDSGPVKNLATENIELETWSPLKRGQEYNMVCGMLLWIWLQYNMAKK